MTLASLSDTAVMVSIMVYAAAFACFAGQVASTAIHRHGKLAVGPRETAPSSEWPDGLTSDQPRIGPKGGRIASVGRAAAGLVLVGFAFNLIGVVARGWAAGRAPWGNMYEFAIVGTAAIAAVHIAVHRRHKIESIGLGVTGTILLILGYAVTSLYTTVDDLIPVLNSYWLVIHVGAAILAGGAFTVAALSSAAFLWARRGDRKRDLTLVEGRLQSLDRLSYAVIVFAFPVWTFAVIAGAVWAEAAWGRYWGWDPKETWAFITWVFYAAYLHAQSTAGWRGARAAWFSLLGYAAFLFNFIGVNLWVGGLHSYAGV